MVNIVQGTFAGGETTPRVASKIGVDKHHMSMSKVFNWIITPQGSAIIRPGTEFADDSLNDDRYKKLFGFPASKPTLIDEVIEIDSNGENAEVHEGNVYSWKGKVRTSLSSNVPPEFGNLSTMRSVWDVSTNSLILVAEVHEPYRLRYDGTDFILEKLYTDLPPEWTDLGGYPNAATFFQNRLWFGGTRGYPNRLWATAPGGINDITGADALDMQPLLEGYIQWILSSSRRLTIGTSISEYSLDSSDGAGITDANARVIRTSSHGSNSVSAVPINEQVMFVNSGGNKLMASNYVRDEDNWLASEISNPAQHMFRQPFQSIKKIVSSPNPDSALFALRADGKIAYCTYDRQAKVNAWSLLDFGAPVIDLVSIKTGRGNYVYMLVERINTGDYPVSTSMEILKPVREEWFTADCSLQCKYVKQGNLEFAAGLGRFEGNVVDVASSTGSLALGKTVVNGQVRISNGSPTRPMYAGLSMPNQIVTLKPSMGQIKDTYIGSKISISNTVLTMFDSVPPTVNGQPPQDNSTGSFMGTDVKDFSYSSLREDAIRGVTVEVQYDDFGYEAQGTLAIELTEPFICEITGASSEVTSNRT